MYRWSLYAGGPYVQVILMYRRSLSTGGLYVQVVLMYVQAVLKYRWSLCAGRNRLYLQ